VVVSGNQDGSGSCSKNFTREHSGDTLLASISSIKLFMLVFASIAGRGARKASRCFSVYDPDNEWVAVSDSHLRNGPCWRGNCNTTRLFPLWFEPFFSYSRFAFLSSSRPPVFSFPSLVSLKGS
jgi:hypothetical protein